MTPITFDELHLAGSALIEHNWVFAKTMPKNPHWYTLRKHWPDPLFRRVVEIMRAHGYTEVYRGWPYTMLDVNGFKYWTMGAPIDDTILINRKPKNAPAPYDSVAEVYDDLFSDEASLAEDRRLFDLVGRAQGAVLDVGCGTGLFLDHVKCASYVGIDPSTQMLERLANKHPNQVVYATGLERYVGPRADLVVSLYGAANYVPAYALQWIPRLLHPGGRWFVVIYKLDYVPVSYLRSGVKMVHYNHPPTVIPGTRHVRDFGNYWILEGWA